MFASKLEVVAREAGAMDPDRSEYVLTVAGAMSLMINSAGAGAMSQRTTKVDFYKSLLGNGSVSWKRDRAYQSHMWWERTYPYNTTFFI